MAVVKMCGAFSCPVPVFQMSFVEARAVTAYPGFDAAAS